MKKIFFSTDMQEKKRSFFKTQYFLLHVQLKLANKIKNLLLKI